MLAHALFCFIFFSQKNKMIRIDVKEIPCVPLHDIHIDIKNIPCIPLENNNSININSKWDIENQSYQKNKYTENSISAKISNIVPQFISSFTEYIEINNIDSKWNYK